MVSNSQSSEGSDHFPYIKKRKQDNNFDLTFTYESHTKIRLHLHLSLRHLLKFRAFIPGIDLYYISLDGLYIFIRFCIIKI